jgi:DNA-binding SARP family transcriptional activator
MTVPNELSLLGGFVFSVEGEALRGISAGSQRLLAFLALNERVVTRENVAATFWPESTDERAGASLRSALTRRESPVRRAVKVTASGLGMADDVVVDVHRFRALARRLIDRDAPLPETDVSASDVSALSNDLLPGWYDDWAVIAAEAWRQLGLHALEAVAIRLTAAGRLAEAAAAAAAAVRVEPLRESARATLIGVHMAGGTEADALRELERYRVLLHAELGLEPTSRLTQLVSQLGAR